MRVLFASSECAPLVKVGGLADVVGGLPKALVKLGVDVAIAIPYYERIKELKNSKIKELRYKVEYDQKDEEVIVSKINLPNTEIPVYLLDNEKYLSHGSVYADKSAVGSTDDFDRFSFFSKAVVEFCQQLKANSQKPYDVIHCHDWHTGWIPTLIQSSTLRQDSGQEFKVQSFPKTLLTIHNMGRLYQGIAGEEIIEKLALISLQSPHPNLLLKEKELKGKKISNTEDAKSYLPSPLGEGKGEVNILLQGILHADLINTVSPTYAREILTAEYGEGLEEYLMENKDKLSGILNGIDYEVWNPETDKNLTTNYSENLSNQSNLTNWKNGKSANKNLLLQTVGLPEFENIPVFGMVTRVTEQKGFDILLPALESFLKKFDARVVILGVGDNNLELKTKNLQDKFKDKLKFITRFDEALAHLIYAGSDFMLVPSHFEPSGLTQLIAMRYGTLPIVRKTGGLADSVEDGKTGFVFEEYSSAVLKQKLEQAVNCYNGYNNYNHYNLTRMVETAMRSDFSWERQAGEYVKLYEKIQTK